MRTLNPEYYLNLGVAIAVIGTDNKLFWRTLGNQGKKSDDDQKAHEKCKGSSRSLARLADF
jgi:hypothetical protein